MNQKTLPPPQEKSVSGNPEKAKAMVLSLIQQHKINPQVIVQVGSMAHQAIKNKTLYPMLKQNAIQSGMLDESDFKPGIDYRMLSILATLGKMTQELLQRGELRV